MRMLLPTLVLGLACTSAQAASNGFYLGGAVTQAKLKDIGKDFNAGSVGDFKIDNTAWKIIAGFRPIDLFAVELNYMDLGSERRSVAGVPFNANSKAFTGYAVGFLPLPVPILDVYGKAGVARWQTNANASTLFAFDDRGTEFAWGGGAQVHFGGLAARLEYERFDVKHTNGVEALSLGLTWTFL